MNSTATDKRVPWLASSNLESWPGSSLPARLWPRNVGGSLDLGAASSMAGEEAGRRGVPSLLNPPSASSEGQQEHIASDVTQVRLLAPSRSLAVPALPCLPACLLGHHEPATINRS